MLSIQERVCSVANRVAVTLGFVVGESNTEETTNRILDSFRATQDLLLELDQSGERDEIARFLASSHTLIQRSDSNWQSFVRNQIAKLQKAQLHQKTIETVGDQLTKWEPAVENADDLEQALRELTYIVTLEPESQAKIWAKSDSIILPFRMRCLTSVLTGLAIIASNSDVVNDQAAFTGASFGASLAIDGMSRLVGIQ